MPENTRAQRFVFGLRDKAKVESGIFRTGTSYRSIETVASDDLNITPIAIYGPGCPLMSTGLHLYGDVGFDR